MSDRSWQSIVLRTDASLRIGASRSRHFGPEPRAEKEPAWCDPMRHGLAFEFDHEFDAQNVKSLFLARMSMRPCPAPGRSRAQDPDITAADPGGRDHLVGRRDAFGHSGGSIPCRANRTTRLLS